MLISALLSNVASRDQTILPNNVIHGQILESKSYHPYLGVTIIALYNDLIIILPMYVVHKASL